ncbi:MAG TPA: carboxypeptidase regulatory-like domain-containing protein [Mycobacteriales bacterium]|nr:carboxypeptidase regulatory-like domain-containing protein [Mycobacteriales bacterium]
MTTFDLPRRDARYGLAGQCYGSPTPYSYGDRARGKPVAVHLGATRTIHVPLTRDGAIAGAVRTGAGQPVSGAEVTAVHHGHLVSSDTSVHGAYTMDGLPAGRYRVCVTPNHHTTVDSGRAAPTGYLQRCAPHAPRRIRVRADEVTRHVNVRLPVGGAIAGLVQSSTRGHPPVADSRVTIYRGTKAVRRHVFTDGDGNFRVTGLAPRPSYAVCARHGYVRTLPGKTFAGRCWRTAAWDGQRVPAAARRIAVTAGDTTRDINLRLRPVPAEPVGTGGSVKGTVTYDGQPVANVEVAIFRNGHELSYGEAGQPTTYDDGSYQVWLDGGDYQICFAPPPVGEHEPGGTPPTGWAGVCYGQTPYDGGPVPPGAATVHVESSNVRGIDAQLRLGGAISGTLQSRGQPLRGATVWIFDGASSAVRGIARTNRNGRYRLTSLAPSEPGYVVCFQSNGRPLSECYDGIPWTH